jgi:surface protein
MAIRWLTVLPLLIGAWAEGLDKFRGSNNTSGPCEKSFISVSDKFPHGLDALVDGNETSVHNERTVRRLVDSVMDDSWELYAALNNFLDGADQSDDSLEANGPYTDWDVSKVTDFSFLFADHPSTGPPLDLSKWDVSQATTMEQMFLNYPHDALTLGGWDVSSVQDFSGMFKGAETLTTFGGDTWVTSSATTMAEMFDNAAALVEDVSTWDTSKVVDFSAMFNGTSLFEGDVSGWDVSSGEDFSFMFKGAELFNADISSWDVSKGVDFKGMFQNATAFNSDIGGWDVSKGVDFKGMFQNAAAFDADIGGWNVSKGVDFKGMFQNAAAFDADIGGWSVYHGTDFSHMFEDAASFNKDLSTWVVSRATTMASMFKGCSAFTPDDGDNGWERTWSFSFWDVSKVQDFSAMFAGTNVPIGVAHWDVSSGVGFADMFSLPSDDAADDLVRRLNPGPFEPDVSRWNVAKAQSLAGMFSGRAAFNSDVSNWDVSKVKNFARLFDGCAVFNHDLSKWDVSSGLAFNAMFRDAATFDSDLSGWHLSNALVTWGMFKGASAFVSDLSRWDLNKVDLVGFTTLEKEDYSLAAPQYYPDYYNAILRMEKALPDAEPDQGEGCTDIPDWEDTDGADCAVYESSEFCGDPENADLANNGHTGDTACCVCGGGTQARRLSDRRLTEAPIRQTNGFLEVSVDDSWGPVCDDNFDVWDAHVACRMMGYFTTAGFTTDVDTGTDDFLIDEVACTGTEASFLDCDHEGADEDCSDDEGVTVHCTMGAMFEMLAGAGPLTEDSVSQHGNLQKWRNTLAFQQISYFFGGDGALATEAFGEQLFNDADVGLKMCLDSMCYGHGHTKDVDNTDGCDCYCDWGFENFEAVTMRDLCGTWRTEEDGGIYNFGGEFLTMNLGDNAGSVGSSFARDPDPCPSVKCKWDESELQGVFFH